MTPTHSPLDYLVQVADWLLLLLLCCCGGSAVDINYYELWHQAYALGAQVVFWPSMMSTPDRDAISLSRLFRYHVVVRETPF